MEESPGRSEIGRVILIQKEESPTGERDHGETNAREGGGSHGCARESFWFTI
jgi:hypothetical protein